MFSPLLAAGGFNLGGASSAAATPAFGQALPATPGFGFGATGVCQFGLALLCIMSAEAASHEPTALKACFLFLQVQHHHLVLEPPSQLLAMALDSQQLKAKVLLHRSLDRWQPSNQHLHLAHLAWVLVLASHRQQQQQVVALALGSRQLLAHLALASDLARHKLLVHHHPCKLWDKHTAVYTLYASAALAQHPHGNPSVIHNKQVKVLNYQSLKLCKY